MGISEVSPAKIIAETIISLFLKFQGSNNIYYRTLILGPDSELDPEANKHLLKNPSVKYFREQLNDNVFQGTD